MPTFRTKLTGIVQGVGFRPFVARLAARFHIKGTVANKGSYVEIFFQGPRPICEDFLAAIKTERPPRAILLHIETEELTENAPQFPDFQIIKSAHEQGPVYVSPDIATCDACARELYDPANRRYLHPFINCTDCGPRLTIEISSPYDRERTTMNAFPMCDACAGEYHDPSSRRYDAQPVCCNDCGPEVSILDSDTRGPAAMTAARQALINGSIVAIKGIGGFHLACDATNEQAVATLRKRKHRPKKPFALMAADLSTIEKAAFIASEEQRQLLVGHQKPILLLKEKHASSVAPNLAPDNQKLGFMLPYAPLQMLLFHYPPDGLDAQMPKLLVMTSGNPTGAPICHTDEEARDALSDIADVILTHNRPIRLRADDTVLDWYEERAYPIRRSRGYAPLPIYYDTTSDAQALAIGGELKNTFALARGPLIYPSAYVGDTTDLRTILALKDSIRLMGSLLAVHPQIIACDLHPRYNTTAVARELAGELHVPLFPVQHHYAHILSCLAENDCHAPILGIALDGTGYGPDGTIWGGEILRADFTGFTRLASIDPFDQAGGDKAPREPWRIAIALLRTACLGDKSTVVDALKLCTEQQYAAQSFLLEQKLNTVISTSAGRLFDAVSALLGICTAPTYEGEAPIRLQTAAEMWAATHPNEAILCVEDSPVKTQETDAAVLLLRIPTQQLFADLAHRRLAFLNNKNDDTAGRLAYTFHARLSRLLEAACLTLREHTHLSTVALSGGVFQNTLLLDLTKHNLEAVGFRVLIHRQVPPNDGGLCLGQAAAALYHLKNP